MQDTRRHSPYGHRTNNRSRSYGSRSIGGTWGGDSESRSVGIGCYGRGSRGSVDMTTRPRIFSISHSCVVTSYRQRHSAVAGRGYAVTLLTPRRWTQFNRLVETTPDDGDDAIDLVVRQPRTLGLWHHGLRNVLHWYPGLTDLFRTRRPDILELWEEPYAAVSWQAVRAFRAVAPRGAVIFFSAQNVPRWIPPPFRWFADSVYRHANACFAMNDDVVEVLRSDGWSGSRSVIPLGIDPATFSPVEAHREILAQRPSGAAVVGFLGKLTAQKGVPWLLDALEAIPTSQSNLFVLMVGSGDLAGMVARRLASLPHPSLVLPAVPHDEVPSLLATMDIVVVPSVTTTTQKEQFGRVAGEAMAAGKAVIASNSGELPNVIGDAGLLVPESDVAELAAAIVRLSNDVALRDEFGAAGRTRAAERYSWPAVVERQLTVYRRVLGGWRRARRPRRVRT